MDSDVHKMRRYMLHHRIATYAIVLFLMLMTFILISISRQIQNEQALLDSEASHRPSHVVNQGTCPANGMPHRLTYNGASSCYFGQYRSVSVRCTDGARAQIINSSTIGSFSVCSDKSVLEAAAKARCGCTGGGQGGSGNPTVPTVGAGTPGQPTPTAILTQGPLPTTPPLIQISGTPGSFCKKGLNSFAVGIDCETDPLDPPAYRSASYACHGGKKGVVASAGGQCMDIMSLYTQAVAACKNESLCKSTTPSLVRKPTVVPTFAP